MTLNMTVRDYWERNASSRTLNDDFPVEKTIEAVGNKTVYQLILLVVKGKSVPLMMHSQLISVLRIMEKESSAVAFAHAMCEHTHNKLPVAKPSNSVRLP
jgi:hypothetical protein